MMAPDDPRHGHHSGYTDGGCRKACCRRAAALAQNLYVMRRAANGGQPLLIDRTGAVRRLRALQRNGWPRRRLAAEAGYIGDAFSGILSDPNRLVTVTTLQRINDLYERLCMTPGPSDRTRRYAIRHGWPGPLDWDDIDRDPEPAHPDQDPDYVDPVVVARILDGDPTPARAATLAERRAVTAAWLAAGRGLNDLSRLTGWKADRYTTPRQETAA